MNPESYLEALQIHDKEIAGYLEEIDRQLRPYLVKTIERTPNVYPLREGVTSQIENGNNRLRAAFCTTSCELFSGSYTQAFYFAAAVEHLQNSMLIHDDITNKEVDRIARKAMWRRFGIAQGINIGDVFISLGTLAIIDSPYPDDLKLKLLGLLCEQGFDTAEGQNLDINLRLNNAPTIDDYIKCAKKKTGSFLAMAAKGGAIIGGAKEDMVRLVNDYAILAGVAFQIGDDMLDALVSLGRPRGVYIKEGKRTILSIYAAENASAEDRENLFSILNKHRITTTDQEVAWVCQLYEKTGAIAYGKDIIKKIVKNALRHITKLPETESKYKLIRISKYYNQKMQLHPFLRDE